MLGVAVWKPAALLAAGLLVASGVGHGIQWWQSNSLEKALAEQELKTSKAREKLGEVRANRDELRRDLREISDRVERLAERKRAIEDRALAAAAHTRAEGEARRRAIAEASAPDVTAAEANEWVFDRLREY